MSSPNSPSDPPSGGWQPPHGPAQWGPAPPPDWRPPPPPDPPPYRTLVPTWAWVLLAIVVVCLILGTISGLRSGR